MLKTCPKIIKMSEKLAQLMSMSLLEMHTPYALTMEVF